MGYSKHLTGNLQEVFQTSIWNESLYNTWSLIVQQLLPNTEQIKKSLQSFCQLMGCEEIILVEKYTFLIISFYQKINNNKEINKYERISTIVKQFKLTLNNLKTDLNQMIIKNQNFVIYIENFTNNTYIVLIYKDQNFEYGGIQLNINCAKNIL